MPARSLPVQGLQGLDWRAPWLDPWRETGQAVARLVESGAALHEALNLVAAHAPVAGRCAALEAPIHFVAQHELPVGMAYEQFIFESKLCPVRPGLHDFFNGLCWLRFPRTKARLNALQATQIAKAGVQPVRGALRDALTLFDENAALLDAPQALWEALAAKDWPRLFGALRPLWHEARLVLFGHALLEKLAAPRKAITAHVWRVAGGAASIDALDAWLTGDLSPGKLAAKPFAPLPVLGVPAWWSANEDPAFYGDALVFRRPAHSRNSNVPSGAGA